MRVVEQGPGLGHFPGYGLSHDSEPARTPVVTKMWQGRWGNEEKKETFSEAGLGMLGWDRIVEDGFVGLSAWIRFWYLLQLVGLGF